MIYTQFHTVVCGLLRQLGLEVREDMLGESGFCTVAVGPIEIDLVSMQPEFINLFCFPGTGKPLELSAASLAMLIAINRYQPDHPAVTLSILNGSPSKLTLWSRLPLAEAGPVALGKLFARFTDISQVVHAWLKAGAPSPGNTKSQSTVAKLQSMNRAAPLFNKRETDSDQPESSPETLLNAHSTRGSTLASIAASYRIQLGSKDGQEHKAQFIQRALHQESGLSLIMKQLREHAGKV